jgi:GIY-YIG catalytic domain-containing protein
MPIDACKYTFSELAEKVLPAYMEKMRTALANPMPSKSFCTTGMGIKGVLTKLGRTEDFSGCYALLREGKPFYVGISRTLVQRLRQHLTGSSHFDASLAYQMATAKTGHNMKRGEAMMDQEVRRAFEEAKDLLRTCGIAFVADQQSP